MYHITNIELINGEKTTLENVRGVFFPTLSQVNDYQRVISDYFNIDRKVTVYVNYKVEKDNHIEWK